MNETKRHETTRHIIQKIFSNHTHARRTFASTRYFTRTSSNLSKTTGPWSSWILAFELEFELEVILVQYSRLYASVSGIDHYQNAMICVLAFVRCGFYGFGFRMVFAAGMHEPSLSMISRFKRSPTYTGLIFWMTWYPPGIICVCYVCAYVCTCISARSEYITFVPELLPFGRILTLYKLN